MFRWCCCPTDVDASRSAAIEIQGLLEAFVAEFPRTYFACVVSAEGEVLYVGEGDSDVRLAGVGPTVAPGRECQCFVGSTCSSVVNPELCNTEQLLQQIAVVKRSALQFGAWRGLWQMLGGVALAPTAGSCCSPLFPPQPA